MRKSDLPNAFIIEVNGRFIADRPEPDREDTDGNVKSATPAHMGELKNAAVSKLVGGRLVSREWIMAVVEGGYGDDYSPKGLWWIDGHDGYGQTPRFEYAREKHQDVLYCGTHDLMLALPTDNEVWMHIQLPHSSAVGMMKMHWQKV
ncbi:hypothetical protein J4E90_000004 [Alternaria incomplexa]|uniref:uncharacterized protein n=1 Tax=Alternaria incomplexa TaxID=1187928 RepID=UPI00221E75E8|nr:uncharacterized protein J4E90_000004 [Alternaria incomplexa]KAI4921578.1 hypothetical protein J4E90_000004 [Alternaria incomplexa]